MALIWPNLTNKPKFSLNTKIDKIKNAAFSLQQPILLHGSFHIFDKFCEYSSNQRLTLYSLHGLSFQSRIEDILTVTFFMDRHHKGLLKMSLQLLPKANGLAVTKLNSTKYSLYEIIWEMYEIVWFGVIARWGDFHTRKAL